MHQGVGPRRAPWSLRVVLLLVALGVVLMHHVAGAHQHTPGPAPHVGEQAASHGPAAVTPHVHHDAPGHDPTGAPHDCLAVLAAAVAALAVAVVLVAWWRPGSPRPGGVPRSVRRGEAPAPPTPVPLRLAQLQVLRR